MKWFGILIFVFDVASAQVCGPAINGCSFDPASNMWINTPAYQAQTINITNNVVVNNTEEVGEAVGAGKSIAQAGKIRAAAAALEASGCYVPNHLTCTSAAERAALLCGEATNPNLIAAIKYAAPAISALKAMSGSSASVCKKQNELLTVLQAASTAYNAACGAAKVYCESQCGTAVSEATAAAAYPAVEVQCSAAMKAATALVAGCGEYGMNLVAGAVGLATIVSQIKQAKSCQSQGSDTDCTKNPLAASCVASTDCNIAANASNPTCVCQKNPRASGCGTVPGAATADHNVSVAKATSTTLEPNIVLPGVPGGNISSGGSPGAGGAAGGAAGGGGIGGSGGTGKGADTTKSAAAKAGLNTNILGGEYGGSGGSGGRSFGSNNANDPAYDKYKKFLPGGENDPARAAASVAGSGEVTGGGGKSNWEKVRERYLDNRSRMMGGY